MIDEDVIGMLAAVNGYIDGDKVIVDENIANWHGRNVVVTILDSLCSQSSMVGKTSDNERRKAAAMELAGLWKDHDELSVEDTVRNMRRGRRFDT